MAASARNPITGRRPFRRMPGPPNPIATRRLALGLRQRDLADQAGLSPVTVGLIEGGRAPQLASALRLARALDCDLGDLPDLFPEEIVSEDTERSAMTTPSAPTTTARQGRRGQA